MEDRATRGTALECPRRLGQLLASDRPGLLLVREHDIGRERGKALAQPLGSKALDHARRREVDAQRATAISDELGEETVIRT